MKKLLISFMLLFLLVGCAGLNVSVPVNVATDTAFILVLKNNPTYKAPVIAALKEVKAALNGSLTYDDLVIVISKYLPGKYAVVAVILQGYLASDKPIFETYLPLLDKYKTGILVKIDRFILLASI